MSEKQLNASEHPETPNTRKQLAMKSSRWLLHLKSLQIRLRTKITSNSLKQQQTTKYFLTLATSFLSWKNPVEQLTISIITCFLLELNEWPLLCLIFIETTIRRMSTNSWTCLRVFFTQNGEYFTFLDGKFLSFSSHSIQWLISFPHTKSYQDLYVWTTYSP